MRTMFVYRPRGGSFYFKTTVIPWLEVQEENWWRGQGYRVEWDEEPTAANSGCELKPEDNNQ